MPREFHRSRRIEDQIQRILSEVLRTNVRDPRLHGAIITAIDVSRDLSVATIHFSSLDVEQSQEELSEAFGSAVGFLRGQLAKELTVRQVPELRFRYDDSLQRGAAMDELIEQAVMSDQRNKDSAEDDAD
jgi:ribosome-binding factor A